MARDKEKLAWRLSVPVMVITVLTIAATGIIGSLIARGFALRSATELLKFNSVSVRAAIHELMMGRNTSGARQLLNDVLRGSALYRELGLVAHPQGQVVASGLVPEGTQLGLEAHSCKLCHTGTGQPGAGESVRAVVAVGADGNRVLRVLTPILNHPACRAAACHTHAASGTVLGFLWAEYSLQHLDHLQARLNAVLVGAALAAAVLAGGALYLMFRGTLARPLRELVGGIGTLAGGDLRFRFRRVRHDEIGLIQEAFNDMVARIEADQERLRATMDYLEGIVENSADLIITVAPTGSIQTFNRGAERALGYMREEVIGKPVEMLFVDPAERAAAIARLRDTDNVTNYETRFRTKNGQTRHVLLTLSRLRDREGNPIGTLGISKDITTEKDLEARLLHSEQIAAIGRAVTGIQHAVKNMLNTVRGGLYVARVGRKRNDEAMVDEGHNMVEEGLQRIADLSHSMLQYAREWKVEREPTDLHRLAASIAVAVKQTAQERGIVFRSEVENSLPLFPCDPRLMHMVLMDLVSNALDACELKDYANGEQAQVQLRISAFRPDGGVMIEVADNGVGMPQEVRENIFTPFFSTKKKGGTGLGLALAARIVELHGGRISVESAPDEGAVFRIALPHDSSL